MRRRSRPQPAKLASLEALYQRQRPHVWRQVLTSVRGDTSLAEDVLHETFLRVWHTYSTRLTKMEDKEVQALLIATAKTCVVDRWREGKKLVFWAEYHDSDVPMGVAAAADDDRFDRVLSDQAVGRFFAAAAKRLTDGEWRVAYMTWAMGKSDPEIAQALNTTVSTVRTHRSAALKKFRAFTTRDGSEITFSDAAVPDQNSPNTGIGEVTV